jgi:hypothetical protein
MNILLVELAWSFVSGIKESKYKKGVSDKKCA